ncbi:uncharacterized protein LOC119082508 [Bradysia coprophila]|uniref:uncharacterized protein LOC119082508 n=1 Tax=Bradysia coprophila TaxID=38358 RepID=UPI00187D8648|nr:uncharacterized protein LOC119082508 [Bradysia coprophila]
MVNPEATGNPPPPNNDGNASISRVTIKIPPFWHENPEIWFAQVEAQFGITGTTTDLSKFNTVESRILNQVTQAVLNPPQNDKYENLKKGILVGQLGIRGILPDQKNILTAQYPTFPGFRAGLILGIFSDSEHKKMSKLLSNMALGDQKPSQLLNEMRRLGGVNVTEEFLKTIWLQKLPEQTRAIVSAGTGNMEALAAIADKVEEVSNSNRVSNVNCTNQGTTNQPKQVDITTSLERKIDALTKAIQSLTSRDNVSNRSRSLSRGRNRSKNRNSTPHRRSTSSTISDDGICWYHHVFGDKADKCSLPYTPCSYVQKNPKN